MIIKQSLSFSNKSNNNQIINNRKIKLFKKLSLSNNKNQKIKKNIK